MNFDIETLKQELEILRNLYFQLYTISNNEIIKHETNRINTFKEELEKGLFFITVEGSLKTGKSTLINILSREEVAITKSGIDTTKAPYIVTKSPDNENKIIEYYLIGNLLKDEQTDIIDNIINDIKGISVDDKRFKKRKRNFNKETIKKFTVDGDLTNETLLINIQINPKDEKSILNQQDIAILDTPGIDGENALKEYDAISKIIKRSNILIVLQSSITPFNVKQKSALKEYKTTISEVRLIHNKFELKNWAHKEDIEEFETEQKEALKIAKENLKDLFDSKNIPHKILNLAKIEAKIKKPSKYKNNEDIEKETKNFLEFEEDLKRFIKINRKKVKQESAKKNIIGFINYQTDKNQKNSLLNYKNDISQKINDINNEKIKAQKQFKTYLESLEEIKRTIISKLHQIKIEKIYFNTVNDFIFLDYIPKHIDAKFLSKFLGVTNNDIAEIQKAFKILNKKISQSQKDLLLQIKNILNIDSDENFKNLKETFLKSDIEIIPYEPSYNIIPLDIEINLEKSEIAKILKFSRTKSKGSFITDTYDIHKIQNELKTKLIKKIQTQEIEKRFLEKISLNIQNDINLYIKHIFGEENNLIDIFEERFEKKNEKYLKKYYDILQITQEIESKFFDIKFLIEGV